ncbi:MAG: Ig-like domain-containing protein [Thermoanaerobaculia bacterium]
MDQVLVVGADGAALDDSAPFSLAFVIPAEAVGAYTIRAFGKNATTNEYFESEPVSLSIQPTATLNSIALFPSDVVLLGAGASQELSVLGQYSDGVPRRIPGTSVTFTPTNPAIVTVTSAGVIEAHSQGDSSVQASYLGHTADAAVFVAPPPPLIFVDNFESADLSWWTSVQN